MLQLGMYTFTFIALLLAIFVNIRSAELKSWKGRGCASFHPFWWEGPASWDLWKKGCCTKYTSIDLVIFEKAYYYPLPVTDSCHGFGITCNTYESKPSLLLIRKPNSSHAFFPPLFLVNNFHSLGLEIRSSIIFYYI